MGNKNNKIIWICSYPKSGNTWLRAIFTSLYSADNTYNINGLLGDINYTSKSKFDRLIGLDSEYLNDKEVLEYKKKLIEYLANNHTHDRPLIGKLHDIYDSEIHEIIADYTYAVIYIVRNPLDVVASLSNHLLLDIDQSIETMAKSDMILTPSNGKNKNQATRHFPQKIGSWSSHVQSWSESKLNTIVIRYEDLILQTKDSIKDLASQLNIDVDDEAMQRIVDYTNFDTMKKKEIEQGFYEVETGSNPFFRKGKVGGNTTELSLMQIMDVKETHKEMMKLYGYA